MSDQRKIAAFTETPAGALFPGYVNIAELDDGSVRVTVRSPGTERQGIYVCAIRQDRGKPGRCFPGDDECNNYCNMAPEKGKMQDSQKPCVHTRCGTVSSFTLSAADWAELKARMP